MAHLERKLFFGASPAPLWSGDSFWSPSGSSGAEALPWSFSGSLRSGDSFWGGDSFLEPHWLPLGRRLQRSPSSSLRSGDSL